MADSYFNPNNLSNMGGPGGSIPGLAGSGTMGPGGQNYSNLPNQPLSGPGGPGGLNSSGVSTATASAPNYGGAPGTGQMAAGGGMQGLASSISGLISSNNSLIQALNALASALGTGAGTPGGSPAGGGGANAQLRGVQNFANSSANAINAISGGNGPGMFGQMGQGLMRAGMNGGSMPMMRAGGLITAGAAAIQAGDRFAGNRAQLYSMNLGSVQSNFNVQNIAAGLRGDVNPYAGALQAKAERLTRENLYRDTLLFSGQGTMGDFFQSFFTGSRGAYEQTKVNEEVSKARKQEESERKRYTAAERYAAVSSADTTTTYLEAQARFKDITKGGATLKRKAAGLASLLSDADTYIGMEKNLLDFYGNVAIGTRGKDGSSAMLDFMSSYDVQGSPYDRGTKGRSGPIKQNLYTSYALGRNPGSMTALLGTFSDELGMNVMEAGRMLNEIVATQGFAGIDFTETYDLYETTAAGKRSYGNSRAQGRVPRRIAANTGERRQKPYRSQRKRGVRFDNDEFGGRSVYLAALATNNRTLADLYARYGTDDITGISGRIGASDVVSPIFAADGSISSEGMTRGDLTDAAGLAYEDFNVRFTDAEVKAFKQRGIATSNIGLAGSLNAGGSGLSRAYVGTGTFGGFALTQGLAMGLRGRGMSDFLNAYGQIGQMYAGRGAEIVSHGFVSSAASSLGGFESRSFAAEAHGFLSNGSNYGSAFSGANGVRQMTRLLQAGGQGLDQAQDMLGMGGIFGTALMASVMADADVGGDYFKGVKKLETMGLLEMRERGVGMLGREGVRYSLTSDKIGQNTIDNFLSFSPEKPIDEGKLKRDLMSGSASQSAAESMADVARTFKAETFKLLKAADRQLKEQVQGNISLKQMKKLLEQIRDNTK